LIGKKQTPFPDQKFPTVHSLCKAVFEHFSAKKLRLCIQGKISTTGRPRPLEAQYQDEFYRAFNSIVPHGVPISSEWSQKGDGRIDFWIPQKKWGIELLRDHSRVNEHCDRFKEGGQYYSWIKAGMLKDWIIIDCATSLPVSGMLSSLHFVYISDFYHVTHAIIEHSNPKLWRAVFKNDYSQLLLLDHKNNPLAAPTVLIN
jgi:hypothetical protein